MPEQHGPYDVPYHTQFPDLANSMTQASTTEDIIQTAAYHADSPTGTVLAHLAQAQANLAVAAALGESIRRYDRHTNCRTDPAHRPHVSSMCRISADLSTWNAGRDG